MIDPNFERTLQLADTSVREMFPHLDDDVPPVAKTASSNPAISKIKEKKAYKERYDAYYEKHQARYIAAGIIHNEFHSLAIPRMGMKPAVMYLNPMFAFVIEGYLEEQLLTIQGKI